VNLTEVVISANKWEANIKEVPNQIEVIQSRDIVFENPATTADMLSSGGLVYVQKSQLGGGSPMIRGFAANRILFVVDGVRMNNAIYRSGNLQNILQADVNSIESTEVIFGPGTNIYGSDALGGVIDVHTLKPKFGIDEKWDVSGHGFARLASAAFEKTLHADINFGNNKWALLTSISYTDFDDLIMGSRFNEYATRPEYVDRINGIDSVVPNDNINKQRFSGYSQLNFIAKIRQQFSKDVDWTLSFYISQTGDVPRYDRLLQYTDKTQPNDTLKYAQWYYRPQQWLMNSLEMNFNKKTKIYDQSSYTLAYQHVREGRNDRNFRDDWLRQRNERVNIFSMNADYDKSLRWENFFFYGLEVVYNEVTSTGIEENISNGETEPVSTRYPDGGNDYLQAGAYFSYKKNYTETPLSLQAGLRYSYTGLNSRFEDTTFYHFPYSSINVQNHAITGSAGLTYRPGTWQLRFNLSSGFRAPNLDDVAKVFDSEPGNVVVPNENLKPEYLYNADLGIVKNFNEVAKLQLSTFFSYLVDAMVRRDYTMNGYDSIWYDGEMSKVQSVINTGSATIYGATLLFDWSIFQNLGFRTVLTFIKGTDDEGYALRHAPPLYGSTSLTYELNRFKTSIIAAYNGEISYENMAPSERNKAYFYASDSNGNPYSPGWWRLDFKGSYAFTQAFLVTFGVENILDYRYRPYSSGITAPGRNFYAALRFSF
jgi:hemoglobin/transferrin/lactoferrin receptor protein